MCHQTLWHTLDTTTVVLLNNETFIYTGNIQDLWLMDSAAQIHPLLLPNIYNGRSANNEDKSDIEFNGECEFNQEHNWPASERKKYKDNVFVEPISEWLGNRLKQKHDPFLMSYLSGIMHDRYDYPPKNLLFDVCVSSRECGLEWSKDVRRLRSLSRK
eukprot:10172049-Ditylum_brightwellii.AAC.1